MTIHVELWTRRTSFARRMSNPHGCKSRGINAGVGSRFLSP